MGLHYVLYYVVAPFIIMLGLLLLADVVAAVQPAPPEDRTENLTNDQTTLVAVGIFLLIVISVTSVFFDCRPDVSVKFMKHISIVLNQ